MPEKSWHTNLRKRRGTNMRKFTKFILHCLTAITGFGKIYVVIVAILYLFLLPTWPFLKCVLLASLSYPLSKLERLFKNELTKSSIPDPK